MAKHKNRKNRNTRRQNALQKNVQRRQQKNNQLRRSQQADLGNFLSATAANAAAAGLIGIAVTSGDSIGVIVGLVLIAISLGLFWLSLVVKRL
ncbi:hypothetical protein HPY09_19530 (plasmid) [Vibrio cholerae]|uniref:Uncharacterized protein n=1 Tax=Vibrio cholerae TaxID=666 RepID=A0A6N1RQ99_VIBCL|nr:hypothetical protein [Vibrio cholerae]EJL6460800.1 hypothetical protein [Vibrio cholerae]MVC22253.1 hypothetical protein [Vibrio cholerae]PNV69222.1 hypothetical protein C1Y48_19370 [Vibrio cholerae]QKU73144.1 hypothetical protein HPY09_19530 [Vibrio cholerae]QKU77134.1 hypothetical protein HPY05_19725 [Vibrio cholerae]